MMLSEADSEGSRARLDAHFLGPDDPHGTDIPAAESAGQPFDHNREQTELPERPRSRKPGSRSAHREDDGRDFMGGNEGQKKVADIAQPPTGGGRYGPGLPWPGGSESSGVGFRPLTSAGSKDRFPLPGSDGAIRKDAITPQGTGRTGLPSSGRHSAGPDVLNLSSSSLSRPNSTMSSESGRSGLIETRNARLQAEHHFQLLKARVAKLAFEEERALKTAKMSKLRADEVKRLREENQARRHKQLVLRQSVMSNLADNAGQRASVSSEQRDQIRNKRWNMVICRQEEAKRIKEQSRRNAEQAKKNSEEALQHAKHLRQTIVDPITESKRQRSQQLALQKQLQAEQIYRDKMAREESEKQRLMMQIQKMQHAEAGMLQRVQKAQAVQADALETLKQSLL